MGITRAEESADFFQRGIEQINGLNIPQEEKNKMQIYYMFALEAIKRDKHIDVRGIINRLEEFRAEYNHYSQSTTDYYGGKAEAMEVAIRLVKAAMTKSD